MPHLRTAAVLPVKRFGQAKQRLAESVAEELRAALAQAMVADVLDALARTQAIERTIVVTSEASVAARAREQGAVVVHDAEQRGQSAAASLGIARAVEERFERVLCVPGDCPTLDPAELAQLLGGTGAPAEVAIVPDRHGTGTNGLLLAPPHAIAPSFGPGSCERHLGLARAAGVPCRLERVPSLLLDVDTGDDLAALRARLEGLDGRALNTRAVLGRELAGTTSI
jgi:2-phospho-L-lactate guanylyltransferase